MPGDGRSVPLTSWRPQTAGDRLRSRWAEVLSEVFAEAGMVFGGQSPRLTDDLARTLAPDDRNPGPPVSLVPGEVRASIRELAWGRWQAAASSRGVAHHRAPPDARTGRSRWRPRARTRHLLPTIRRPRALAGDASVGSWPAPWSPGWSLL